MFGCLNDEQEPVLVSACPPPKILKTLFAPKLELLSPQNVPRYNGLRSGQLAGRSLTFFILFKSIHLLFNIWNIHMNLLLTSKPIISCIQIG